MTTMLQTLLAEDRPLLADGATGTNLFGVGLASGESPELWNADHPDRIRALHQAFVDAGSDIILTNSFGGNRRRLALHGAEARARELNRLAAENARAVADKAVRPVVVAGSVGPTGDIFAPLGPLTEDEAVDVFAEQIDGLREGGADVVWIETMSAAEEISAAALAAARVGAPFTVTASFDTAGRTMMGVAPAAHVETVKETIQAVPLAAVQTVAVTPKLAAAQPDVLRLAEEQLQVGKEMAETGRTRVRRFVTEKEVAADVTLHEEHAELIRKAISDPKFIGDIDWADEEIEVVETAEHAVAKKTAKIVEEVALRKVGTDHVETIRDKLRRQQVEIERVDAQGKVIPAKTA